MSENIVNVSLSAINPYVEVSVMSPREDKVNGKDFISFGERNGFPQYILDVVDECGTITSVINGSADFVIGKNIEFSRKKVNRKGETIRDIMHRCAVDYFTYGGFFLHVIRNAEGGIAELYWLDAKDMRSDKDNEVFFYSEDWTKSSGRVKYLSYPKFSNEVPHVSSVMYVKNPNSRGTYALPIWYSVLKSVIIEGKINDFHLNAINNGFSGSYILNFSNGIPTDEVKEEIEADINEKFAGAENAGRMLISFSADKEHAVDVKKLEVDDYGERYNTLAKRSREQIFGAFGATPALFGIMTETTGFSQQEFEEAYKLYSNTRIAATQGIILEAIEKIYGERPVIEAFRLE